VARLKAVQPKYHTSNAGKTRNVYLPRKISNTSASHAASYSNDKRAAYPGGKAADIKPKHYLRTEPRFRTRKI